MADIHLGGMGMGNVLALVISFVKYKSLWWAFWHGVFGWFYVIYYLIKF